jgi:hypothetical protein
MLDESMLDMILFAGAFYDENLLLLYLFSLFLVRFFVFCDDVAEYDVLSYWRVFQL